MRSPVQSELLPEEELPCWISTSLDFYFSGVGATGNGHTLLYQRLASADLIGVCEIAHKRADVAAARLRTLPYYDASTLLAKHKPDILSVATAGFKNACDHYLPTI